MTECFIAPAGLMRGAEARRQRDAGLALPLGAALAHGGHLEIGPAGGRRLLPLAAAPAYPDPGRPRVMGIVNATPDSFSDGGRFLGRAGIEHAERLVAAGAEILDIGGESTRPGAAPVSAAEEIDRVCPVIEGAKALGVAISVDTRNMAVMRAALAAGADIVNDVSALGHDPAAAGFLATVACPVVLMHARGTPATMQQAPHYDDLLFEVLSELAGAVERAVAAGIARERLIVDPGIGFAKGLAHNLALIDDLHALHALRLPVLLGVSRKSFIGRVAGEVAADRRLPGSLAAALAGLDRGASILRVHDVAETVQAVKLWSALAISDDSRA
ncbi:dihydropteroate synthase [Zavarzinia compransoris]|uniref:Dihydropteroate synthase n=1 Tax=Zavarzinia compransoris TaxID=1264899 RepID=A0A317EAP5_9PROT|nr:dihydropteroate synthase [Zavarzinia compransoris]PWR22255.1 dihydropteroate synthase [Zavarzinia compransoris]TDP46985.1 dihydropteroate synthase [Zavarzinia compransoris]